MQAHKKIVTTTALAVAALLTGAGLVHAQAQAPAQAQARSTPLDELRRQIEAGQFEQAWATAQASPQLLGDVHFDFLYGVAAINVGRVSEGLLALERHLAAVPANDRARLELARGYFLLGEYTRARSEFEFVLRFNPPAGVRTTIAGFLQAMQTREASDKRASARFYIEAGGGYDNNVNAGTFRDSIDLPFGPVSLQGSPSKQVADGFGQVAIGGQQLMRVTNRLAVFAGADIDHRAHGDERAYDISNVSFNAGFSNLSGIALWRATLASNTLLVGGNRYRDTLSVAVEANMALGAELAGTAFVQYAELRHPAADEARDARATTIGASLTRNFPDWPGQPSVGLRVSWTTEQNQSLRSDLDRNVPLVRVFGSVSPFERLRVSAGITAFQQKYGNIDLGFGTVRDDSAVAADLSANWTFDARWSARLDGSWSRNRSNQDLYDSSRKAASLKLRYQY